MREKRLVAGRFVELTNEYVVDLATGDRCVLTIATAGGASEQTRWAVRCETLRRWRHPSIAPLIDFGPLGESQRFEAWRCGSPWTGQVLAAERVRGAAVKFLESCGLTTGLLGSTEVRHSSGGPVLLPSADTGFHERDGAIEIAALDVCAIEIIDRPAIAAIAELFEPAAARHPCVVSLWGPSGAGKSTALVELARVARGKGLVPISIDLLASPFAASLSGRTLFILDDERRADGCEMLLHSVLQSPKPHVLVSASAEELPWASAVALTPVSTDALIQAVRPLGLSPALQDRVRRAAKRSGGQPGRFAMLLGLSGNNRGRVVTRWAKQPMPRVAEQSAIYDSDEAPPLLVPAAALGPDAWPAPGEMSSLRRKMDAAMRLIACGRRAPGERALRQAIGSLVRRSDWTHAIRGAQALAESLLMRGRVADARALLEDARGYCARAEDQAALLEIAVAAGHAWVDLGRLDEAESVVAAAIGAARARASGEELAHASLAMARCLFWRGRYADADAVLTDLGPDLPDRTCVRLAIAASRHAVGRRDLGVAVSRAAEALERAHATLDARLEAAASYAAAFAHLAVCDLEAVDRDAARCITQARAARDPLRAIRARLLLVESARRRQRRSSALHLLNRLAPVTTTSLPPIVVARCHLFRELLNSDAPIQAVVARHMKATELMALALWTLEGTGTEHGELGGLEGVVNGLIGILRACQEGEEEAAVLTGVCTRVRGQLRAAAVAFVAADAADLAVVAADGGRIDLETARRAIDAGMIITPHRMDDRIEAAAPIRYGGVILGAVLTRWTLGAAHTQAQAAAVLRMAATAAAPAMAVVLARRRAPAVQGTSELLGISAAMTDVRRAVERAAAAPFSVLIEGESGCGKELVARAIHRSGPRRARAFCTLNCAALPDELVESELFGHARGAFTGAVSERPGVFEEAHGGTLLLDEVGELSPRAQAKVLRVIQEGELRRVGENTPRRVDVRILSATNRDLRQEVAGGRFRLDLLYRLDVLRIAIPPLRERREDVAELVERLWNDAAGRVGSRATLTTATVAALARYDWPGNVRELQNVLAALAVRTPKRGVVPPAALPPQFGGRKTNDTWRLDEARRTFEAGFVRAALIRTGGHRTQAARELGVTRQGLAKLMSRLSLVDDDSDTAGRRHAGVLADRSGAHLIEATMMRQE